MNKLKSFLVRSNGLGSLFSRGWMDFIKGADVSMLKQLEDNGAKFYDENNKETECMTILRNNGVNYKNKSLGKSCRWKRKTSWWWKQ